MAKRRRSKTEQYLADVSKKDSKTSSKPPVPVPSQQQVKKDVGSGRKEYLGREYPERRQYPGGRAYAEAATERVYALSRAAERLYPAGRLYPDKAPLPARTPKKRTRSPKKKR